MRLFLVIWAASPPGTSWARWPQRAQLVHRRVSGTGTCHSGTLLPPGPDLSRMADAPRGQASEKGLVYTLFTTGDSVECAGMF